VCVTLYVIEAHQARWAMQVSGSINVYLYKQKWTTPVHETLTVMAKQMN
jgi:hypothetical protein